MQKTTFFKENYISKTTFYEKFKRKKNKFFWPRIEYFLAKIGLFGNICLILSKIGYLLPELSFYWHGLRFFARIGYFC